MLFDSSALRARARRASQFFSPTLFQAASQSLVERIWPIKRSFHTIWALQPPQSPDLTPLLHQVRPGAKIFSTPPAEPVELIISVLQAHWIEDLPSHLAQLKAHLAPDGLLLMNFWGGATLQQLRHCLVQAEVALTGGCHARVIPMIPVDQSVNLLQKAGFWMPVADQEEITCLYQNLKALVAHLRQMGETNSLLAARVTPTPRNLFHRAEEIYRTTYPSLCKELPATFQLITLTGWQQLHPPGCAAKTTKNMVY